MNILQRFEHCSKSRSKQLALLMDPDKTDESDIYRVMALDPDYIFLGGSLLTEDCFQEVAQSLRDINKNIPVVLFPGGITQVHPMADAILFLSLISGRNPELLIGKHVEAAPRIRQLNLECIPTGYMLVESGKITTAQYITQTTPIPYHKPEIAASTAMAGEMLGMKCMYLDAGSGADKAVSNNMISAVRQAVSLPIIVGGGITTAEKAQHVWQAGADIIVIGSAFEEKVKEVRVIADLRHHFITS